MDLLSIFLLTMPSWTYVLVWLLVIIFLIISAKSLLGIVYIAENKSGIVTKKFGGGKLKDGEIIALNKEPGIQADLLSTGLKFRYWPWQYSVQKVDVIEVREGEFRQVLSIAGKPLDAGRNLANVVDCSNFQDARKFLNGNGQRGQQLSILLPGKYRINTKVFQIQNPIKVNEIDADRIGRVTVLEGRAIDDGEMAKADPGGHNHFQDPQKFIDSGGYKGLQISVLQSGRYSINPWFAQVEEEPMTEVPVGHAGVVISYVGKKVETEEIAELPSIGNEEITAGPVKVESKDVQEKDAMGVSSVNAILVNEDQKGVWRRPLETGKYPINRSARNVVIVPITQITLYWADTKISGHELDKDLSTIILRTKDAFDVPMVVAVIIHIPLMNSPMIVANFGSVQGLISQVLQPTISSYFRNSAQGENALNLYQQRTQIQAAAKKYISEVLRHHFVECKDVLIDDVKLPETLTSTLTTRQIAEQEKITFSVQTEAQQKRKELKTAEALADIQSQMVTAEQGVTISRQNASAVEEAAKGTAAATRLNADANAHKAKVEGEAEGVAIEAKGMAEAKVIKEKVDSMGDGFTLVQIAEKLMSGEKALVPDVFIGGGAGADNQGNAMQSLLTMRLVEDLVNKTDKLRILKKEDSQSETSAEEKKETKD